jgi:hypothetical protein
MHRKILYIFSWWIRSNAWLLIPVRKVDKTKSQHDENNHEDFHTKAGCISFFEMSQNMKTLRDSQDLYYKYLVGSTESDSFFELSSIMYIIINRVPWHPPEPPIHLILWIWDLSLNWMKRQNTTGFLVLMFDKKRGLYSRNSIKI